MCLGQRVTPAHFADGPGVEHFVVCFSIGVCAVCREGAGAQCARVISRYGISYPLHLCAVGHGLCHFVYAWCFVLDSPLCGNCFLALVNYRAKASSAADVATNSSDAKRHAANHKSNEKVEVRVKMPLFFVDKM